GQRRKAIEGWLENQGVEFGIFADLLLVHLRDPYFAGVRVDVKSQRAIESGNQKHGVSARGWGVVDLVEDQNTAVGGIHDVRPSIGVGANVPRAGHLGVACTLGGGVEVGLPEYFRGGFAVVGSRGGPVGEGEGED